MPRPSPIRVKGLDRLQRNLDNPKALGKPMRNFLDAATLKMLKETLSNMRRNTDTGEGLSSVRRQVDSRSIPKWGKVFSNKHYIRMIEGKIQPHFPRVDGRLEQWARRRGLDPWAVAVAIAKKGTRAQRNFTRARFASRKEIQRLTKIAGAEITDELERS